ncbi:MAG TPA: RNA polymerase factor sigma-32 [Pseudobdellovibrionaceae bacterium]|nr:RNA polymerase factor sigma-32 [Pseudobdellovibrionaceae bacterium]
MKKKTITNTNSTSKKTSKTEKSLKAKPVDVEVLEADEQPLVEIPSTGQEIEPLDTEPLVEIEEKSLTLSQPPSLKTNDPLVMYLNEVRRYPLLTKEQESSYAKKYYETKNPEIAQILVKHNLRFVVKIAAEYSKFGAKMIDLIQEGNIGLMHAVREFNPYKGVRLITYAVWWIRGYIQEFMMKQYSLVRIGTTQNQKKLFYNLQREKEKLDQMGDIEGFARLSSKLGIPEDEIREMAQRMRGKDVSLDRPMDDEGKTSFMDLQRNPSETPMDEQLSHLEQLHILSEKIDKLRPELSEREKILLEERILNDHPLTLQEIGEKYGITREAIRQAEVRLLKKIKDKMLESE